MSSPKQETKLSAEEHRAECYKLVEEIRKEFGHITLTTGRALVALIAACEGAGESDKVVLPRIRQILADSIDLYESTGKKIIRLSDLLEKSE